MRTKHRNLSKAKRRFQADPSVIYRVMGKFQDFTPDEHRQITLPVQLAFERIKAGAGTDGDFHVLAAACNVSMVCSEKIDPLVEVACLTARDALLRCKERHTKTGRWGFDGPALSEVVEMIDVYTQLAKLLKPVQLQNAMTEALRRARNGDGLHQPEFELEQAA
jgi:hypothetical protein